MADPAELLALATRAARAAGMLLVDGGSDRRPTVVAAKSSPTDVVTAMDRRAEALITERIRVRRPADAILGEETGESAGQAPSRRQAAGSAAVRWIVDPLDGTVNYLYGLPDWAVSIAVEVEGTVVAGVVDVPRRGEVFTAVRGGGAWLRRTGPWHAAPARDRSAPRRTTAPPAGSARRVRCNRGVPLAGALVATGFGYRAELRRAQGRMVAGLLPQVRDIRRGGSAAIDLCLVAAGRVDAYYERGLRYWDHAAGGLIAQEAGARVADLAGGPVGAGVAVAAAPDLHAELAAALTALDPERAAGPFEDGR